MSEFGDVMCNFLTVSRRLYRCENGAMVTRWEMEGYYESGLIRTRLFTGSFETPDELSIQVDGFMKLGLREFVVQGQENSYPGMKTYALPAIIDVYGGREIETPHG